MLKKILIGLIVIVGVLAVVIALRPSEYSVSRSTVIAAPAPTIFSQVNDFQKWNAWSPWDKIDPAMKRTYEGPPSGNGAVYKWEGNKDVGKGSMTIVESKPNELIRIKLEFVEPMAGVSDVDFVFKPEADKT